MWDILKPDLFLDSIHDLDWDKLRARGIRALILDLDNTLVGWRSPDTPPELLDWIKELKARGFVACLVSNNFSDRVSSFGDRLGFPHVPRAAKPRRGAFRKAMSILNTSASETAVIGDQVFTDVLGGNRLGLFTVLVVPINNREFIGTRAVRMVERMALRFIGRDQGSK